MRCSNAKNIKAIIVNAILPIIILATLIFASLGIGNLIGDLEWEFEEKVQQESDVDTTLDIGEEKIQMYIPYGEANVRKGPGVEHEVAIRVEKGHVFNATGETAVASNGKTWYEVYLDETMETTG